MKAVKDMTKIEFACMCQSRGDAMRQIQQTMEELKGDPGGQLKALRTLIEDMDVEGVTEIIKDDPLLSQHDAVRKIFMTRDLLKSVGW